MTPWLSFFAGLGMFVSVCWASLILWIIVYGAAESLKKRSRRRHEWL